jgi:hypothetical protein
LTTHCDTEEKTQKILDNTEGKTDTISHCGTTEKFRTALITDEDEPQSRGDRYGLVRLTVSETVCDDFGLAVGESVGTIVGIVVGVTFGKTVGGDLGLSAGEPIGYPVGIFMGLTVGETFGNDLGLAVGEPVGAHRGAHSWRNRRM